MGHASITARGRPPRSGCPFLRLTAPRAIVNDTPSFAAPKGLAVAKPELGTKRVCPVTGRKFYDLNRDPVCRLITGESYPRSFFEPAARGGRAEPRAAAAVEDGEDEVADVEVISLEEADGKARAPRWWSPTMISTWTRISAMRGRRHVPRRGRR